MRRRTQSSPVRPGTTPNPGTTTRGIRPTAAIGAGLATLTTVGLAALAVTGFAGSASAAEIAANPQADHATIAAAKPAAASARLASAAEAVEEQVARDKSVRDAVVRRAMAQVGDSYAAGATGPNAFDCSGLVVYSWRSAGVKLEHYSYAQYKQTQRISVKDAVPGDLAFYFRNGAHHVGIYIGNGKIVNASDYGIGVIVSPLKGTDWTDAHFTGMGRVKIPS